MPILPNTNISLPNVNIAALQAIDVTNYNSGVITQVLGLTTGGPYLYCYQKGSVATPNGTTIVAPTTGVGNWILIASPITPQSYELNQSSYGLATLAAGTASVDLPSTLSTTIIFLTPQSTGTGIISVGTVTSGAGFTIESTDNTDVRQIAWIALNNV